MLLRGFGLVGHPPPAPIVSTPQLISANPAADAAAAAEIQRRVLAAGITTEQQARDWLTQQTGLPFGGTSDQAFLAVLQAKDAAAAAAASSPATTPPPPVDTGPSLTTIAIGGAVVLGVAYFLTRH